IFRQRDLKHTPSPEFYWFKINMTAFVGSTQTNLTFSFEQKADTGRKKAACGGFHLEGNLCIAFTIQGYQIRED
ncbi:TPA: hypothetical protein ACIA3T_002661, partial [Salmonella enterica subsp. enterica serovar Saintpaul]